MAALTLSPADKRFMTRVCDAVKQYGSKNAAGDPWIGSEDYVRQSFQLYAETYLSHVAVIVCDDFS